ncbi:hypothetical protein GGI12_004534 [Dipsacomyces acuminosporus]|nr:hypothetical protein GGI12_004534 [Dipsacomyces acuminosporus]
MSLKLTEKELESLIAASETQAAAGSAGNRTSSKVNESSSRSKRPTPGRKQRSKKGKEAQQASDKPQHASPENSTSRKSTPHTSKQPGISKNASASSSEEKPPLPPTTTKTSPSKPMHLPKPPSRTQSPAITRNAEDSSTTLRSEQQPHLPRIYEAYYDESMVDQQIAAGILVRGVLRINPKQQADAYVSLDQSPNSNALRMYPKLKDYDVGAGNDIYICGEYSRNRAISGDIVAVKILAKNKSDRLYMTHRLRDDKRKDRDRAARRRRLEGMADAVEAEVCGLPESEYTPAESSQSELTTTANDSGKGSQMPEVFGAVVAILSRNESRQFTGSLSTAPPKSLAKYKLFVNSLEPNEMLWFKPLNSTIPHMVLHREGVPSTLYSRYSKRYCTVRMSKWSSREPVPRARFVKDLGQRGSLDIETMIIIEEHDVAGPFAPNVLSCLPSVPWHIPEKELKGRTDLRSECIFTIDPPTARDLDDAVSCKRLSNGNLLIGVHIADVSYFVRPKTALDREAKQRATTTYMVQRAYPMLPSLLCEELCSLNPGVDRLAFSVMWEMDCSTATVLSTWFGRTIISSACKLAYDDAQSVIDGKHLPGSTQMFERSNDKTVQASASRRSQVESSIKWFYSLSKIMRQRRFDSGALSLSSVKLSFDLDSSGTPIACRPYIIKDSNRLIEEFMLLANMSVAARIEQTFPDASLLRRHSPPLPRRLDAICEQLRHSGIDINPASASDIQASLNNIADPDTRATVESILTGPMQRAAYFSTHSIDDKTGYRHYALNVPLYTHFTSPIRRYADVIVHRTLEASLAVFGNFVSGDHPLLPKYVSPFFPKTPAAGSLTVSKETAKSLLIPVSKAIAEIAHQCNLRKDAAKKAQEASSNLFLVHYLLKTAKQISTPGAISVGVVTKIREDGFVVTVPTLGIEGVMYMDRMADRKNQVVTTDGRQWKLNMWSVQPASLSLVWSALPPSQPSASKEDETADSSVISTPSPADALAQDLSALVIDDNGHSIAHFSHNTLAETVTQTVRIFDKVTVTVLPTRVPPDLTIKLAMPSIY